MVSYLCSMPLLFGATIKWCQLCFVCFIPFSGCTMFSPTMKSLKTGAIFLWYLLGFVGPWFLGSVPQHYRMAPTPKSIYVYWYQKQMATTTDHTKTNCTFQGDKNPSSLLQARIALAPKTHRTLPEMWTERGSSAQYFVRWKIATRLGVRVNKKWGRRRDTRGEPLPFCCSVAASQILSNYDYKLLVTTKAPK